MARDPVRGFDLSGGKRGRLDAYSPPALPRPEKVLPATAPVFRIALWIGIAVAILFGTAILSAVFLKRGPLPREAASGVEMAAEPSAEVRARALEAEQSASEALRQAQAVSAEADRASREVLRDAEAAIARARAAAGEDSGAMFDEAEAAIARARAEADGAAGQD